jgi:predicted HicB family RNase H-like nuclease
MTKSTLYLEDRVHQALRLKAAETKQSMSELVNDALKASLQEDLEDISSWR